MSPLRHPAQPHPFQYPAPTAARISASRSLYPTFLSVPDSVLLQLTWAWRGLYDSFRWGVVLSVVASDSEIRANVYKSFMLNSLSLLSIYIFDLLLQPLVQNEQKWFPRNIGWFYHVLWLLPILGTSLYLNGTWCTIIAKRTYLLKHGGRPSATQPATYTGMLRSIATSAYRVVMVFTSVVVSFALSSIPALGHGATFVFLCWVDSYYCFEYVWIARGLSLSRRIRHLEERWAYYFAFGLPTAALCSCSTGLASAAIFGLVFPAYIIMAMHAKPVPADPYNPMPPVPTSRQGENESVRHPSPFVPIRLPIFALVIWLNDAIVRVLNVIAGRPVGRHKAAARSRAFSDASESAEGGAGQMELKPFRGFGASTAAAAGIEPKPAAQLTSERVKISGRRKHD